MTVSFKGANLQGASFKESDLSHADFREADLRGCDFSNSRLDFCNFTGALVDETTCFDGTSLEGAKGLPAGIKQSRKVTPIY